MILIATVNTRASPAISMAKSKASSLSSAEVRWLWEEPAEETGQTSGSVGILAIYGGEDVKFALIQDC